MNRKAYDLLVAAALRGQKQAYGQYEDEDGGLCALGVLGWRRAMPASSLEEEMQFARACAQRVGLYRSPLTACPECASTRTTETNLLIHLNDDHKFDFLTIANKMPITEESES